MVENQKKLHDLLLELSRKHTKIDNSNIQSYTEKLKPIYREQFRHLYSDLFRVIIQATDSDMYSLDRLAENIRLLHEYIQSSDVEPENFKINVLKLYDHLNLDISRIRYTEKITERWNDKLNEENVNIIERLQNLAQKAESVQKDNITILGIFSSIVITFVAGMVFSGSVLNNIDKVSIYRLIFVIIVLALMLFNLLQMLLGFLRKVHFRDMDYDELNNGKSFIAQVNVFLIMAIMVDFILWGIYWYRATGFKTFIGY